MDEEAVLEIDAHMRDSSFAVGEEDDVALAELALGDKGYILLDVVRDSVQTELVDLTVNMAYEGGAVHPLLGGAAIFVRGAHPSLDGVVELLVVVGSALDA